MNKQLDSRESESSEQPSPNVYMSPEVHGAISDVLSYLWHGAKRGSLARPPHDLIVKQLTVDLWLQGLEHNADRFFGGCPRCGREDGYLNVGRAHWFVCHKHRTRWLRGMNLFGSWRHESKSDWTKNWKTIAAYEEVEPVSEWPPRRAG